MLQHGQRTTKAPLIWVQSLMALVLLFYFHAPGSQWRLDSHRSKILRKLQSLQGRPDVLHYSSFDKCNSVYCILEGGFDFSHFKAGYNQPSSLLYVGSTAVGVAKRHLNRMAVYRRLKTTEFEAELSLRYWASHENLFGFVIVPLKSCADYQAAWAFEHELITQWQTQLNYPRAMQFLKIGLRVSRKHCSSAYAAFGLRLWPKLRKRLHGQCKQFTIKDCRQLAWNILYVLGSHTKASLEAARMVRSKRTSDEEVYALIKLSRSVENSGNIAVASAASTFFPGRDNWKARSRALFDLWLKRHRLPHTLHGRLADFCDEQRAAHAQALEESDRLTWSQVQGAKAKLHQEFVLYNEDHHPNPVVCYCPQFYMRSILTTWDDPATFESLQGSPKYWQQKMLKNIPSKL